MKKTRTQLKRLVFGYMACIIAFLAAFVFVPVRSFAEDFYTFNFSSNYRYNTTVYISAGNTTSSQSQIASVSVPAYGSASVSVSVYTFYNIRNGDRNAIYYNGSQLSYQASSRTLVSAPFNFSIGYADNQSLYTGYIIIESATPTPSPTPIPTPSPTPTPNPYGNELGELTEINNHLFGAVGAITTSANNAGFWSSFLFIGLPLFILILSIIAWIIFGGED